MTRMLLGSDQGAQPAVIVLGPRLPADHPVFEFIESVRAMDMSRFRAKYRADGVGRPPHDPWLMVALILYCYSKHQFTPPQIAMACIDDLGARVITGNRCPSERTIRRFLDRHREALNELLVQTVRLGERYGLVDTRVVACDGTLMAANASMHANCDETALRVKIDKLQQEVIEAHVAWWASVDPTTVAEEQVLWSKTGDEAMLVSGPGDTAASRRLQALQLKLRRHEDALAHLLAHPNREVLDWRERLERDQERVRRGEERVAGIRAHLQAKQDAREALVAAGHRIPGTRPVPVDEHAQYRQTVAALEAARARASRTAASRPTTSRVNVTDPGSAVMPGKHDGFDQRHNVQAAACRNQFILEIGLHESSNDKRALVGLLEHVSANLTAAAITRRINFAVFDAGYASEANFTANLPFVDELLVAVERDARQSGRLTDGVSTAKAAWADMSTKLADAANALIYKLRSGIIEPVFAQLFNRFGTAIHQRGAGVLTELRLRATVHNLLKIHRARRAAATT